MIFVTCRRCREISDEPIQIAGGKGLVLNGEAPAAGDKKMTMNIPNARQALLDADLARGGER